MKKILLTKGKFALVDDEDFDWLIQFNWHTNSPHSRDYAVTTIYDSKNNVHIKMHRLIMDVLDKNILIDHIDRDGLNNQKSNFRFCNNRQNGCNSGLGINNTSGYKGVSWVKSHKKWRVQITHFFKVICVGSFDDAWSAAKAYNRAAIKYHGEFAYINQIIKE